MKPFIWVSAIILIQTNVFGQKLNEFKSVLDNCGMHVEIPSGFREKEVFMNDEVNYDYAICSPDQDFELRYAIHPILLKHYANDTLRNEMQSMREFRNTQYGMFLETIINNINGGVDIDLKEIDKNTIQTEFNATWGAIAFVELNSEFGKGFKYCMVVAIHKKDVADAYYFYLSNTKDRFMDQVSPLFHTLKFD
jgi:hypothetical protein